MKYTKEFEKVFNLKSKISLHQFDEDFLRQIQSFMPDNIDKKLLKEKLDNIIVDVTLNGSSTYDYLTNKVNILLSSIGDFESFAHEIFHAISVKNIKNGTTIGLRKIVHNKLNELFTETIIGTALNEGSNTYFTSKFLSQVNGEAYDNLKVASFYKFCTNIFTHLVNLVGEEKAKEIHFFGGFDEFVKEINKNCYRKTDSKIIKLVSSLDSFFGVSTVNRWVGVDYSLDARILLTEAYKSTIDLFIFKGEKENNVLPLDQILVNDYLSQEDLQYFNQYVLPELYKHYNERISKSYKSMVKNKVHISYEVMEKYSKILILKAILGKDLDGNILPEKLKCGEFYNFVLISCSFIDENFEREGLKTNDIQRLLTVAFFDKTKNFMPNDDKKMVTTIQKLLASKIAVRAGIEVSDDLIIDALNKSIEFNNYLIESDVDFYKTLYPSINETIKYNEKLLKKCLNEVFLTKVEKYKLKKQLPEQYLTNNIKDIFDDELNF